MDQWINSMAGIRPLPDTNTFAGEGGRVAVLVRLTISISTMAAIVMLRRTNPAFMASMRQMVERGMFSSPRTIQQC